MEITELVVIITATVGMISTAMGAAVYHYTIFKKRIHAIAEAFKIIDEALYDDKVTEAEFRAAYEACKKVANS